MIDPVRTAFALALLPGLVIAAPARAKDPSNVHAWDFRDRSNADRMARATVMWQVEQAEQGGGAPSALSGGSRAAGLPSTTSVANMTIVTVTVGDNSHADVIVDSDQHNVGDVNSTAVVATGNLVDIGQIGSVAGGSQ